MSEDETAAKEVLLILKVKFCKHRFVKPAEECQRRNAL